LKQGHQKSAHSEDVFGEDREYWWNEDFLELMAERLGLDQCKSIVDVGCGIGALAFKLSPYFPSGSSLTGVDLEKKHVKKAKQRTRKMRKDVSFNFIEGDAQSLPIEDDFADLCYCQTLLIHVDDPSEALAEMKRVTKPGGWLVALEPNNLVPNLMFDTYEQTNYNVDDIMQNVEVRLRCEKGKKELGEGFNSLGDALPDLFKKCDLEDIQVWISDKALPLIPPYDTREKRVRAAQMIEWLESESGGFDYDENLRYFKAGGGKKLDFDAYWDRVMGYKSVLLDQLKKGDYISAGGSMMYIVAAKVK
jgi:ubiquinone/menaquinone biosynthesis C-methylase UbiE